MIHDPASQYEWIHILAQAIRHEHCSKSRQAQSRCTLTIWGTDYFYAMKLLLVILQLSLVFCANFLESVTPTDTNLVKSEDDDNTQLARMKDSKEAEAGTENVETEEETINQEEDEKDLETTPTGGDESVEAEEKLMASASSSEDTEEMDSEEMEETEMTESGPEEMDDIDKEEPEDMAWWEARRCCAPLLRRSGSNARVTSSKKMKWALPKVISLYSIHLYTPLIPTGTSREPVSLRPTILHWQVHIVSMLTYNVKRL